MTDAPLLTTLLLPLALGVVMFGLGLSLTPADFTRVSRMPKAVAIGLAAQMLVLPLACLGVVHAFKLPPTLAVGLMLLAASPGGAVANLYSHLARGDVALNVTLTAINSVLAVVTLPLIVNLATLHFMGREQAVPLQFGKVAQTFAIVLGPVGLGMVAAARTPRLADRLRKPLKILSVAFLIAVIAGAGLSSREHIVDYARAVGGACLVFNLVSLAVGYGLPRLLALERPQAIAIAMEVGIHNATLAITVALSPLMLGNAEMAVPAAVYGVLMFFTSAAFGWLATRGANRA